MKKAQVTIFIILGIVIVIAVFSIYKAKDYFVKTQWELERQRTATLPADVQDIRVYTESCVEEMVEEGIKIMGLQGGYIIQPAYILETNFSTVTYAYYNGRKILPSIEKMQGDLALYVELFSPLCFDESNFPDFNITTKDVNAQTTINQDSVSVTANYPVSVSKGSANYDIGSKYYVEIPVRLGRIHDFANGIVEREISDPNNFDVGYLLSDEFDTEILPQDNNTIITYVIKDSKSMIDNEAYIFMFANKFEE